jgi:hypothetical protein
VFLGDRYRASQWRLLRALCRRSHVLFQRICINSRSCPKRIEPIILATVLSVRPSIFEGFATSPDRWRLEYVRIVPIPEVSMRNWRSGRRCSPVFRLFMDVAAQFNRIELVSYRL